MKKTKGRKSRETIPLIGFSTPYSTVQVEEQLAEWGGGVGSKVQLG
jgi:hypothetical protein